MVCQGALNMMTQSGAHVLNTKRLKNQAMLVKQHEEPFSAQQLAERSGCFCSKEIKERMAISLSNKNRLNQLSLPIASVPLFSGHSGFVVDTN
jgi:hypothetical protein